MATIIDTELARVKQGADDVRMVLDEFYGGVTDTERIESYAAKVAHSVTDTASEQIISTAARTTAGGVEIKDTMGWIEKIKGQTLVWNQLVDFEGEFSKTTSGNSSYFIHTIPNTTANLDNITGHVVLFIADCKVEGTCNSKNLFIQINNNQKDLNDKTLIFSLKEEYTTCIGFVNIKTSPYYGFRFYMNNIGTGNIITFYFKNARLFDLTTMFGSGNEPTTIDNFCQRIFGKDYADVTDEEWQAVSGYCEPTLLSSKPINLVSKGRNLFDADAEQFSPAMIASSDNKERYGYVINLSKGKYYLKCFLPSDFEYSSFYYYAYVVNKNTKVAKYAAVPYFIYPSKNSKGSFEISEDEYFALVFAAASNRFINVEDIKRYNISLTKGEGEPLVFEPYKEPYSRPIDPTAILNENGTQVFPDGLKSAGSVYDEIDLERGVAVKRVGVIADLSSLVYAVHNSSGSRVVKCTKVADIKIPLGQNSTSNVLSIDYVQKTYSDVLGGKVDKSFQIIWEASSYKGQIWLYDSRVDELDVSKAKQILNGVKIYYELATPIEYPLPSTFKQHYRVSNQGTEKITADGLSAPIRATIAYKEAVMASEAISLLNEAAGTN